MRIEVVTLFPEVVDALRIGLLGKAIESGRLTVGAKSPREYAHDKHRSVDDTPYGGGAGMVMRPGPVVEALEALDAERSESASRSHRILMTPQGQRFDQSVARRLAQHEVLTFVCGRYEGFDERIRSHVDEEVSLGDFVLLGGEIAALTIIEAVVRLRPGVIGNAESIEEESHSASLLEYPQYTRPAEFRGEAVPEILMSGDHARIRAWRREQSVERTWQRRPDLLAKAELTWADHVVIAKLEGREPPPNPAQRKRKRKKAPKVES